MDFLSSNRQFDWIEISLVYDKSDKHLSIYDCYNAKCAARLIKSVEFTNICEAYSTTNTKKFDTLNDLQKFLLYKQFVAWHCDGCTIAPLTDCVNNQVIQELPDKFEYFGYTSDKKIYIDLRDSLGYTDKIEKPSRNDSKLTLKIKTKNPLKKK